VNRSAQPAVESIASGRARPRMRARELLAVFAPYIRPERPRIVLGIGLVVLSTATTLLRPWPIKYLFDRVLEGRMALDQAARAIALVALALFAIATADGVLRAFRRHVLKTAGQHVGFRIQTALYGRLQEMSLGFHERTSTGELITRITRDVDKVQDLSTETLVEAGSHLLKLAGMIGVMLWLDWRLSAATLLLLPLLIAATAYFNRRVRRAERSARGIEGAVTSVAQEALGAVRLIKAYGREAHERERFAARAREGADANIGVSRTEAIFSSAIDALVALVTASLLWLGARRVLAGSITPGDLFVFVSYLRDFYEPVGQLSKLGGRVSRISVRAEKVAEVLTETPAVRDEPDAREAPRFHGEIELRGVDFAYRARQPVLDGVSFRAAPGSIVALVGASGSGKSTVASLVPRLYDPVRGEVAIDGEDVRRFTLASLRAQIAWVLQTSVLFHASVHDNIAYGKTAATREEVEGAARAANAHDFIAALPRGYDTIVGERGDTLSGGQRQRIAIARALIRDAPILILDEPTTGLDAESQQEVLAALEALMQGRTTLVIAHDLTTIRSADQILVFDRGRIVERGTHDDLMASRGRYAELVEARVNVERPARRQRRAPSPH